MSRGDNRFLAVMIAVALTAVACSDSRTDPAPTGAAGSVETTTTVVSRDCTPIPPEPGSAVTRISALEPDEASISLAGAVFPCADDVVVTAEDDLALVAVSAQLAAALGGPLLIAGTEDISAVEAELERLGPLTVTLVGQIPPLALPDDVETKVLDGPVEEVAGAASEALGTDGWEDLPTAGVAAAARVLEPIAGGLGVMVPASRPVGACNRAGVATAAAITRQARSAKPQGDLWLVDVCSPELAMAAAAAARFAGGTVLLFDGSDPGGNQALVDAVPGATGADRIVVLGDVAADADWQMAALLAGNRLPGGGLTLFPGRRIVSLYGNPTTSALGVLGEQGPDEAAILAKEVAAPYGEDGVAVLPGFEIIATVASAAATADGDYSWEMPVDDLRPWVEVAARDEIYVTLDLQPGRTDFLTQAKLYEELLLLPHVGLALDPEWRLEPNERHLRQIGSVDAAEINEVVDWLADMVRDNALPEKLLILHQFNFSMITNRELVKTAPGVAVLIHADGQGPIHTKYQTYEALTGAVDGDRRWWGWKNFYDEDSPTPTPQQVLALDPVPEFVSYQ